MNSEIDKDKLLEILEKYIDEMIPYHRIEIKMDDKQRVIVERKTNERIVF